MEVQITVAKDGGERIEGDFKGKQWHGYSDGIQTWKPIRIPMNAMTTPEYTDSTMTWNLDEHAEGIGMTGWDWVNKLSRWVAFDFDAITGHSDKHAKKLSDDELISIRTALQNIPYVTIRKSTGGKGLHVYVFLECVTTENHTEHAAVARAILSQLSGIAGFDFSIKVDTCGGNMWVWHRKMAGTDGLQVIKQGVDFAKVPANWRDYTKVVSGRRVKNLPRFIEEQETVNPDIEDIFSEVAGQRMRQPLDLEHKKVMTWLTENYPNAVWWDAEHHMLVTHTTLLKEAHSALMLRGQFETSAKGEEKGFDHNCFLHPISRGAWSVRRYTLGVAEHPYWRQDGQGWTSTTYNREPTLEQAAALFDASEDGQGWYHFSTVEQAQKAALLLGANLGLPAWAIVKPCKIKMHKSGRILVEVDKGKEMPSVPNWVTKSAGKMERLFHVKTSEPSEDIDVCRFDDRIRHLVDESGNDCGWAIKKGSEWDLEPYCHVKTFITGLGYKAQEVSAILSNNILQRWKLVNKPFQDEYPKNREWNRKSAQLRYKPSLDRDTLKYPTWLKILNHLGKNLTPAVQKHEWCKTNNILTGADWLKCWISSMFKEPNEPLPYLFFYGEQNSGKSILHEALSLLICNGGVCRGDQALTSSGGFNGELEGAVLVVIEETDLKKNMTAYNRIKDWVTSRELSIHKKTRQPILVPNTGKYIQCANSHLNCPVFAGDTRITMISVDPIPVEDLISKKQIIPLLEAEASDFLAEILNLELPVSPDRLNIPCIVTEEKLQAEEANQSLLDAFCNERVHYAPGYKIQFTEFYEAFEGWLSPNDLSYWSKIRVGKELNPKFPKARDKGTGQFWIGNMSFTKVEEKDFGTKYTIRDGKLYQEGQ
jgi:hypothetical protein